MKDFKFRPPPGKRKESNKQTSATMTGLKRRPETVALMSESSKGQNTKRQPVLVDGVEYKSLRQASLALGYSHCYFQKVARGEIQSKHNLTFK